MFQAYTKNSMYIYLHKKTYTTQGFSHFLKITVLVGVGDRLCSQICLLI